MNPRSRIAVTLGDGNGIGPEVTLKALQDPRVAAAGRVLLIGSSAGLQGAASLLGLPAPRTVLSVEESLAVRDRVAFLDPCPGDESPWRPGAVEASASAVAAEAIRVAVRGCLDGALRAVVTAPICKEGFARAGIGFPGHTEFLARLTRTRTFAMMLFGGPLRVVLVTRHDPIAEVPRLLTRSLILKHLRLTAQSLPWLGVKQGRIAVCGLNPHAGEGGTIGREEIEVIAPAVRAAKREGLPVEGPLPADTVFHAAARGDYAAVVAMYHDQGLAPLKLIAFDEGVNVTLGLPIVRTSPDHGTAFGIAGKGLANPSSMIEAIRHAAAIGRRPNPWAA